MESRGENHDSQDKGQTGVETLFYVAADGERKLEDPRLWRLGEEWREYLDGSGQMEFENLVTKKRIWSDPRLHWEELRRHEINVKTFPLI